MKRWRVRPKQRRTPLEGTRRAANWREIQIGQRLVNKHGELTDWVVVSELFRPDRSWIFIHADVECLGCGRIFEQRLNNIIQGRTRRCVRCSNRSRMPGWTQPWPTKLNF
jgi:hypothetical protein